MHALAGWQPRGRCGHRDYGKPSDRCNSRKPSTLAATGIRFTVRFIPSEENSSCSTASRVDGSSALSEVYPNSLKQAPKPSMVCATAVVSKQIKLSAGFVVFDVSTDAVIHCASRVETIISLILWVGCVSQPVSKPKEQRIK